MVRSSANCILRRRRPAADGAPAGRTVPLYRVEWTPVQGPTVDTAGFEVVSGTWGFFLRDLGGRAARLVVRTRWTWSPGPLRWIGHRIGLEPAHFVVERRMLLGIKRRAEGAAGTASP